MKELILGLLSLLLLIAVPIFIMGVFVSITISLIQMIKAIRRTFSAYSTRSPDLPVRNLSEISLSSGQIEFQYDMKGGRLRAIGPIGVQYGSLDLQPSYFGNLELKYDSLGSRLRYIGSIQINYDKFGSRPKWLGTSELQYDKFGNRLCKVGAIELQYESVLRFPALPGGRPKWIGDIEIQYDELRSHPLGNYYIDGIPKFAINRDNSSTLDQWMLIVIFFVFYERNRRMNDRNSR